MGFFERIFSNLKKSQAEESKKKGLTPEEDQREKDAIDRSYKQLEGKNIHELRQKKDSTTLDMFSTFDSESGMDVWTVEKPQPAVVHSNDQSKSTKDNVSAKEQGLIEAGKERKQITAGDGVERPLVKFFDTRERRHKVVVADITKVVDRYAKSLAEKKLHENMEKAGYNFLKKAVYRLAEDGYTNEKVGKYFLEAKQEILNNRNLLSLIETKLARKSEGVALRAGDEEIHNEILDKIIESFEKNLLDESTKNQEVKAERVDLGAAQNARVDAAAADLVVRWCFGQISDKKSFDSEVEQTIVPLLEKSGARQGQDVMYANNLLQIAEGYKREIEHKLGAVGTEFGADQRQMAERHIRGCLRLDIMLGEKSADLYQKSPNNKMKYYEKYVDWVQKGSILSSSVIGGKASRAVGRVLSNPLLYAAVGNIGTRAAMKSAGVALGTGLGIASGIAFMPATAAIIGSGVAAGLYMRARAARERRRDLARRQEETVMGLREGKSAEGVEMDKWRAENLIQELQRLETKQEQLTLEEKQLVGQIQSRIDLQAKEGVDLIGVTKENYEKYKGKFVMETQVRAALKKFSEAKLLEYGSTPEEQLAAYNRFKSEAIPSIVEEVRKVNEKQAEEIRTYANKVGLRGAGIAMLGSALTPFAGKMVEKGLNHFLGTHFNVDKVTYFEELGHKIQEWSGHGHPDSLYSGVLLDQAPAGMNLKLNLPPGYKVEDLGTGGGQHIVRILDADGHVVPGAEHLPFDANGNIADPRALDGLHHNGWVSRSEAGALGRPGSSGAYTETELRADGFTKTPRADWHHIKDWDTAVKKIFNGKELQAYKNPAGGGSEDWNVSKMLNNLSDNAEHASLLRDQFGIDSSGHVDTQLQALQTQMAEWYRIGGKAEIAKHLVMRVIATEHDNKVTGLSKIFGFDENGHLNLDPKYIHAAYKEIALRDDFGQYHILATDPSGGGMVHGATEMIDGHQAVLNLYSPMPHNVDTGVFAGYRRSRDKDLDKYNEKKANRERQAEESRIIREQQVRYQAEVEQAEKDKKAKEEIIAKLANKEFSEQFFNETAEKYGCNKEGLAQSILEAKGVDHQVERAEMLKAATALGQDAPSNLEMYLTMIEAIQAGEQLRRNKVVSIESGKVGSENQGDNSGEAKPETKKEEKNYKKKFEETLARIRDLAESRVYFETPNPKTSDKQWQEMVKVVGRLERVLIQLKKKTKIWESLLTKTNKNEKIAAKKQGLIVKFDSSGNIPSFHGNVLEIPSGSTESAIRKVIVSLFSESDVDKKPGNQKKKTPQRKLSYNKKTK